MPPAACASLTTFARSDIRSIRACPTPAAAHDRREVHILRRHEQPVALRELSLIERAEDGAASVVRHDDDEVGGGAVRRSRAAHPRRTATRGRRATRTSGRCRRSRCRARSRRGRRCRWLRGSPGPGARRAAPSRRRGPGWASSSRRTACPLRERSRPDPGRGGAPSGSSVASSTSSIARRARSSRSRQVDVQLVGRRSSRRARRSTSARAFRGRAAAGASRTALRVRVEDGTDRPRGVARRRRRTPGSRAWSAWLRPAARRRAGAVPRNAVDAISD